MPEGRPVRVAIRHSPWDSPAVSNRNIICNVHNASPSGRLCTGLLLCCQKRRVSATVLGDFRGRIWVHGGGRRREVGFGGFGGGFGSWVRRIRRRYGSLTVAARNRFRGLEDAEIAVVRFSVGSFWRAHFS